MKISANFSAHVDRLLNDSILPQNVDWNDIDVSIFDSISAEAFESTKADGVFDAPEVSEAFKSKKLQKKTQIRTAPNIIHWVYNLLQDPQNETIIKWSDYKNGEFKIVNGEEIGKAWGTRRGAAGIKKDKPKMKYENFA